MVRYADRINLYSPLNCYVPADPVHGASLRARSKHSRRSGESAFAIGAYTVDMFPLHGGEWLRGRRVLRQRRSVECRADLIGVHGLVR